MYVLICEPVHTHNIMYKNYFSTLKEFCVGRAWEYCVPFTTVFSVNLNVIRYNYLIHSLPLPLLENVVNELRTIVLIMCLHLILQTGTSPRLGSHSGYTFSSGPAISPSTGVGSPLFMSGHTHSPTIPPHQTSQKQPVRRLVSTVRVHLCP